MPRLLPLAQGHHHLNTITPHAHLPAGPCAVFTEDGAKAGVPLRQVAGAHPCLYMKLLGGIKQPCVVVWWCGVYKCDNMVNKVC